MQQLMASLVFGMSVDDAAYRTGMASARAEAKKTEQDFTRAGGGMGDAIQNAALQVNRAALAMVDSFNRAVTGVKRAGLAMTVGLTLPLGLMGQSAKDTAASFQAAMNNVKSAMLTASPKDLERLRDAAMSLGPAMGRSSIEAAAAIESLAKNGMSAAAILGGGLKAALTLATVGQSSLSDAADLTTDIMAQFGKSASDLPKIVDNISGALDASKLSMDDFKLAAGQAGGVAGALGYTFEDFNTGLAATAPLFESGASAGTSYRAFLTSLAGKSESASKAMDQLGLDFYKAGGGAKSLAEIADELQKKMGNLSSRSKSTFLTAMFGADGGQTAVKLIELGADGIERAQRAINGVTADQKVAILLDGEVAATQRLAAAWEKLKIGIGEAGLIQVMTGIKNAMASMVETIAGAPPALFYMVTAMGAVAAVIGPVILGVAALVGVFAPMIVGMTSVGFAARILVGLLGVLINPVGMLGRGLLFIAAQAGAGVVVTRLTAALAGLLGPIGLAVTAAAILWPMIKALGEVSEATAKAQEAASQSHGEAEDVMQRLATATGKAKDEAIKLAKALRTQHLQQLQAAKSALILARIEYIKQRDFEKKGGAGNPIVTLATQLMTGRNRTGAARDLVAANDIYAQRMSNLTKLDAAYAAAAGPAPAVRDLALDDGKKGPKKRTPKGRDTSGDQARYENELGQLRVDTVRAEAELGETVSWRFAAEMAALAEERASYVRNLATDDALDAAKRATLLAAKDQELQTRRTIAARTQDRALANEDHALARTANEAEQDMLRAKLDLVDSVAARRSGELALLAVQKRQEVADIELVLATETAATAEYQRALDRKAGLDALYAGRAATIERSNEGPTAGYLRGLNPSGDAMRESVEAGGIDALRGFNNELVAANFNVLKLGDAFANMGQRIMATLADIVIQQKLIKPLAAALLGDGNAGGGGGLLGSLTKALGFAAGARTTPSVASAGAGLSSIGSSVAAFGGFRAKGGPIAPNKWYMVGEEGPEPFFSGRAGTMLPNGALGLTGRREQSVKVLVEANDYFDARVDERSTGTAASVVGSNNRTQARAASRRLR